MGEQAELTLLLSSASFMLLWTHASYKDMLPSTKAGTLQRSRPVALDLSTHWRPLSRCRSTSEAPMWGNQGSNLTWWLRLEPPWKPPLFTPTVEAPKRASEGVSRGESGEQVEASSLPLPLSTYRPHT